MINGLIFDLGGVVVEWSNSTTYCYIEETYGILARDFKSVAERSMPNVQTGKISETTWMRETFRHFGTPPPDFDKIWGKTFEAAIYSPRLLELLSKLRTAGYRLAAISNLEPSRAKWLREHGIDTLFDAVIFSCEEGLRKPDISMGRPDNLQIYKLTLSRLGLGEKECLFIDDNEDYVKAAESLGIRSILFENVEQLRMELTNLGVIFEKVA